MTNMSLTNHSIYEYVMDKAPSITKTWFAIKDGEPGSIYSKNTSPAVEEMLKKQHAFTIQTVISAFLEDESIFADNLEVWANEVAKSRVELATPVHEVLEALSITRKAIWDTIEQFILEHKEVSTALVLQWSTKYHSTFDQLTNQFTSMYHTFTKEKIHSQEELIQQLSVPVIPITDSIGVLPLIGDIDSLRAKLILETVPVRCKEEGIEHLFIDLSGISSIDTMVLHELMKLTKILSFIGIESTISGLSPDTAQMIAALGIKLGKVSTFSTLKQALSLQEKSLDVAASSISTMSFAKHKP
ncbi:STAS domain-containing protein [Niallia circulans]|uniref:STAS domain-containing protein n=1 Tax=Niallia circulans TaxID=1397 RepID=UPI0011A1BEF6|nr:STAS domain-containing protein [Niallia circulans]MCM2981386.1 STAS domain-containing protein [Niallia circulans]